ncbi:hypothetical protein BC826DRAFT_604155 [Russula brevipes]|nr:hypothetical protein BC826DRAFT_604155 [Russula brevipes]
MGNSYCPTARKGVKCTDSSCLKKHDVVRCEPCDCYLPVSSLKQHQSGKQHLQNLLSKGSSKPSTSRQSPSPSISSSRQSAPPPGATPLSGGVVVSRTSGRSIPPAYCATTLLGDTCVDSRCPHSHDILRCEPCGRSFPASVFDQHRSGSSHLEKVASNTPTDPRQSYPSLPTRTNPQPTPPQPTFPPSREKPPIANPRTPQPPPSQPIPANPQPTSSQDTSPPSSGRLLTDPRVTVTHEDGLDLVVEGIGAATGHAFPPANHIIVIEKTNVESSLTVKSMALVPSPSPWCEWFGNSIEGSHVLVAALSRVSVKVRHEKSTCHLRPHVLELFTRF